MMEPVDCSIPVRLKVRYTSEVWFKLCLMGPAMITNSSTATTCIQKVMIKVE